MFPYVSMLRSCWDHVEIMLRSCWDILKILGMAKNTANSLDFQAYGFSTCIGTLVALVLGKKCTTWTMAGPHLKIRGCFWLPADAKGQGAATAVPPSSSIPHPTLIEGKKRTRIAILKCAYDVYPKHPKASAPLHKLASLRLPCYPGHINCDPKKNQCTWALVKYSQHATVHANTWKCLERSKQERRMNALYWHLHLTLVTVTTWLGPGECMNSPGAPIRAFLVVLSIPPNTAQTACFEQRTIAATVPLLANDVVSIKVSPVLGADYGSNSHMQSWGSNTQRWISRDFSWMATKCVGRARLKFPWKFSQV